MGVLAVTVSEDILSTLEPTASTYSVSPYAIVALILQLPIFLFILHVIFVFLKNAKCLQKPEDRDLEMCSCPPPYDAALLMPHPGNKVCSVHYAYEKKTSLFPFVHKTKKHVTNAVAKLKKSDSSASLPEYGKAIKMDLYHDANELRRSSQPLEERTALQLEEQVDSDTSLRSDM